MTTKNAFRTIAELIGLSITGQSITEVTVNVSDTDTVTVTMMPTKWWLSRNYVFCILDDCVELYCVSGKATMSVDIPRGTEQIYLRGDNVEFDVVED